jgi:predicted DNA-binding ribbon-helix-helix protein
MKRYAVELDAYLWASSEEEAKQKAMKMAELLRSLDDNHARPIKLVEAEFGKLPSKSIEL